MVRWWMRCFRDAAELEKPTHLNEGLLQDLAKSSTESREFSPVNLSVVERTPFEVSNVQQLEELLEEIDKAIYTARKRTSRRDLVPRSVICNVNDAETVLNQVTQFCQNFNITKDTASKVGNELYKTLCDILQGVGNLHWAAAGLSMVAFVLSRMDMVGLNAVECLDLLETMRDLGKHVVTLCPQLPEQDEKLRHATCLITEGSILCCDYMKSGILSRFGFAAVTKDDLLKIRNDMTFLYPDLILTTTETILARTAILLRQSSMPLAPVKPDYPTNKVGLDEKVDAVLQMLGTVDGQGLEAGIRAVVLHGMGGIGKSTLGMALHARLPFVGRAQVKVEIGESPTKEKIRDCQRDMLHLLSGQKMSIPDCSEGRQKLGSYLQECTVPTLLFIDNIFRGEDLEILLPDKLVLPAGSCIIVTSRDASVCAVLEEKGIACQPYLVAELGYAQARELLCVQVFNGLPAPPNRERLVNDLLNICCGLPLALEVVGRYLRRHKADRAWNLAIRSLQECRPVSGKKEDQLYQSLMFSYNQLAEDYQKAFLDITCLLGDTPWDWLEPIYGERLVTLEELALVNKINEGDGFVRLQIHDLLLALGRNMQLGTRIWSDSQGELPPLLQEDDMGKCGIVEGLSIKNCADPIHAEKLDAMHSSLRVLILQNVPVLGDCCKKPRGLQMLGIAHTRVPYKDFAKLDELQVLMIRSPTDFESENVEFPKHLKVIILDEMGPLKCLPPAFGELSSLHTLEISWCQSVQELPENFCQLQCLRTLILAGCEKIKELPREFQQLLSLQILDLSYCQQLEELPNGFGLLVTLQRLDLCGCKSLRKLPEDFARLRSLEFLHLGECENLESLPEDFGNLICLQDLNLTRCRSLDQLPEGFEKLGALRTLSLERCDKLSVLPLNFGQLYSLGTLRLSNCPCLQQLPASFLQLRRLRSLDVSGCPLADMNLLEELAKQQECRVVCEDVHLEDSDYLESTDHDSTLSAYCESIDPVEEYDFEYNMMYG